MAFKDLEHDGNEEFNQGRKVTKTRKQVQDELKIKQSKQPDLDEVIDKLQEKWLNPENPFLWTGEL